MLVASSIGILLLFADTDLASWRRNRALFANDGFHSRGVREELDRYHDLLGNGTIPQIATVLFGGIALVALAGALRRSGNIAAPLPFVSLAATVVMLAILPSKWIYHFGSAAALFAAAVAVGVAQLRAQPRWLRFTVTAAAVLATMRAIRASADAQYFMRLGTGDLARLGKFWPSAAALTIVVLLHHFLVRKTVLWDRISSPETGAAPPVEGVALPATGVALPTSTAASPKGWVASPESGVVGCLVVLCVAVLTAFAVVPAIAGPSWASGPRSYTTHSVPGAASRTPHQ